MTNQPLESGAESAVSRGREFWRSLEELAQTSTFHEWLGREFPQGAAEMRDPASRRSFLKLMGASLALASLTGCQFAIKPPARKIVPYVRQPELVIPGRPLFYATAALQQGYGIGLLAESHEGRPTKLEGNPDHPSSLGSTDLFVQASILTMYDPDRSTQILKGGQPSSWQDFVNAAMAALAAQKDQQGAGVRLLTPTVTSPTFALDVRRLFRDLPKAQWISYEPLGRDGANVGANLAFGKSAHPVFDFSKADVVVALDSDFTSTGVGNVRYARDFAERRKVRKDKTNMNRLYVAEPTPTPTGSIADHRLPARASAIESIARAIAIGVGIQGVAPGAALSDAQTKWVAAVVKDLSEHKGTSLLMVGDGQPAVVHALSYAINKQLNNIGATVNLVEPVEVNPANQIEGITKLVQDMKAGQVQVLLILGGNPAYNAPADLDFAGALKSVPFSAHQSLYVDETSSLATWHINATHFLEEWGDARAHDGTVTIIQPLIAPLYDGKSASDVINALLGTPAFGGYTTMVNYWRGLSLGPDFDKAWMQSIHDGFVKDTAAKALDIPTVSIDFAAQAPVAAPDLEVVFRPDPSLGDGSQANNGWLQELPKPITKLVWDNALYVSPGTAKELGLATNDLVTLTVGGASVTGAVMIVPGQADKAITVHYGYGRTKAGRVAAQSGGFNAYTLRTTAAPYYAGAQVAKLGKTYELATTQLQFQLVGRKEDIVPSGTLTEFLKDEHFLHSEEHEEIISLYPAYEYKGYAWGMSIDLNVCTGCNACVVACQAENNIAIVGKSEVLMGREMQWIRLDQYFAGSEENPEIYSQPMMCQHCENAPCELVCPVAATQHDSEGLNVMVYNRCVGTKYCSNNCPYKVRRFNFLQYTDEDTISLKLGRNPDVTVRSRGVMEKCTYCLQRITEARIDADREDRTIQDGQVITACQQVCPTQAIVFGNINDVNAQVTKLKAEPLTYTVLDKLNPKPRTSYMARLRNINPELGGGEQKTE